ncbi:MAG: hypothetical protein K0R46_3365 [Herbinix sp.]|jgi:hypothetical protein|nr:hypothetical protein [Herbinix sp.]
MDEMKNMRVKIMILNTISIIGILSVFSFFSIMGYLANVNFDEWIKEYSIFDIHQPRYDFYNDYALKYGIYEGIICLITFVCMLYKKKLTLLIKRNGKTVS